MWNVEFCRIPLLFRRDRYQSRYCKRQILPKSTGCNAKSVQCFCFTELSGVICLHTLYSDSFAAEICIVLVLTPSPCARVCHNSISGRKLNVNVCDAWTRWPRRNVTKRDNFDNTLTFREILFLVTVASPGPLLATVSAEAVFTAEPLTCMTFRLRFGHNFGSRTVRRKCAFFLLQVQ